MGYPNQVEFELRRKKVTPERSHIDRGYTDYGMFSWWTDEGIYFVTRQKQNAIFTVIEERSVPKHRNILKDQLIEYDGFYSKKSVPVFYGG